MATFSLLTTNQRGKAVMLGQMFQPPCPIYSKSGYRILVQEGYTIVGTTHRHTGSVHTHIYTHSYPPVSSTYWYPNSSQAKTDMMLLRISEEPHIHGSQETREAGLLGKNYICHFSQERYLFSPRTSKEMLEISFARTFWHIHFFSYNSIPSALEIHSALRCKHIPNFKKKK